MAKTKVKQDCHGLYVRTGGYLFRTVPSCISHRQYAIASAVATVFRKDQVVLAHHLAQTTLGVVRSVDKTSKEFWFSHGMYNGKKSEDVFTPIPAKPETPHPFVGPVYLNTLAMLAANKKGNESDDESTPPQSDH